MRMNYLRSAAAAGALVLATACGGSHDAAPSSPPAGALRVDESKAATLAGRVAFEGTVPENAPVKMGGDPYCVTQNPNGAHLERFDVTDGGLNNVFVYVKDGLGNYYFDTPTEPVKLDQQGCRYHPHVLGIRVGQPLEIVNSDETMHNVHAMPAANREFNLGQAIQHQADKRTFTKREVMIPFKCDVHGWMQAFIGVMDNPYFAVTHDGGKFEIKNLPAGTYTIEAWHEKLGTETQTVTLADKQSANVTFTFKAPAAAGN